MGWYLRKSLRLGPLRINLSKSGIGGSVGVTGFRVGAGPKGPYLHGGRDGLYFKKSLSGRPARTITGEVPESDREKLPGEGAERGDPTLPHSEAEEPGRVRDLPVQLAMLGGRLLLKPALRGQVERVVAVRGEPGQPQLGQVRRGARCRCRGRGLVIGGVRFGRHGSTLLNRPAAAHL